MICCDGDDLLLFQSAKEFAMNSLLQHKQYYDDDKIIMKTARVHKQKNLSVA